MSQSLPKYATAAKFDRSTVDMAAARPVLERSDLVLACAHVLHTNGQSTHETVQAAERLGTQLGLRATMIAHWDELELRAADALKAGAAVATGALVACLLVGGILAPVARRWRMPFAAIGFASVVSMMPGVFLLRMASGLVQLTNYSNANFELLRATVADVMTAIAIILAMSFGVVAPKLIIDRFSGGSAPTQS